MSGDCSWSATSKRPSDHCHLGSEWEWERCRVAKARQAILLTHKLKHQDIAAVDRGPNSELALGGQFIAHKAVIYP